MKDEINIEVTERERKNVGFEEKTQNWAKEQSHSRTKNNEIRWKISVIIWSLVYIDIPITLL